MRACRVSFRRWLLVAIASVVLVAGCGSGGSDADGPGEVAAPDRPGATNPVVGAPPDAEPPDAEPGGTDPAASDLPAVDVRDVHTGATVDLASLVPADRPILLWFWAPH